MVLTDALDQGDITRPETPGEPVLDCEADVPGESAPGDQGRKEGYE